MRLLAYEDSTYHCEDGVVYADRAFLMFLGGLSGEFDRVVLAGRLAPEPGRSHYALPAEVEFVALPYYPTLADPRAVLGTAGRLARAFWRRIPEVDAVFVMGPHPFAFLAAGVALLRRRGVVLGVRQDLPRYTRSRHPGRRSLHLVADAIEAGWRALARVCPVVVVGPDLVERYRRSPRRHELRVSLVSDRDVAGEEVVARRNYDRPAVLSVGRIEEEKNPLLLADVLRKLRETGSDTRMVVCGTGPLEPALRERAAALGVADALDLRGYVPVDGGLLDVYRSAEVLLHVSWTEGLPQVLFEAFAARLPVVATDVGGIRQAVGDAAIMIPPGDADAAAAAVRRVCDDEELRTRLIAAGLALVRDHTIEREHARLGAFIRAEAERRA